MKSKMTDDERREYHRTEFLLQERVHKVKGYPFPGHIKSFYWNGSGQRRYVVECCIPGMEGCQHIFSGEQLELLSNEEYVKTLKSIRDAIDVQIKELTG